MIDSESKKILDDIIIGRVEPHIYAFMTNTVPNYLKVGDTYRPVATRLKEWKDKFPELENKYENSAAINENIFFRDYSVHKYLEDVLKKHRRTREEFPNIYYSPEFFKDVSKDNLDEAIEDIHEDYKGNKGTYQYYDAKTHLPETYTYQSTGIWEPRPNQQEAIDKFKAAVENRQANLLMYAVMRFGKSFTSLCCAQAIDARLILVVSGKADVCEEWKKTVQSAENFKNYEFLTSKELENDNSAITSILSNEENEKSVVVFLTLQDLQGPTIKDKHQDIFGQEIDLLIVDETHYGARSEHYGEILRASKNKENNYVKDIRDKYADEDFVETEDMEAEIKSLSVKITLHLSGTPYRILMGSEFHEEDIIAFCQFSDIMDEQKKWNEENLFDDEIDVKEWDNPYYGFPEMIRFAFNPNESARKMLEGLKNNGTTYALSELLKPKSIKKDAKTGEDNHKKFVHEREVLELFEAIDGSKEDDEVFAFLDYDKIKEGHMCQHMVCVLPYCASCDALEALIQNNKEKFKNLGEYEIINISGVEKPKKYKNVKAVKTKIKKCAENNKKTLTLTVNRMLTGSTVEEWDTMIFLKDTASPQEYDQAIFRIQNQYIKEYVSENNDVIKYNMKPQTLLVDFAPHRMFILQEEKAQIYNINTDLSGNDNLGDRLEKELKISPIIVMNKNKIAQVKASDILREISDYSRDRGVQDEAKDIPIDMSLLDFEDVKLAIEKQAEIGSRKGFSTEAHKGEKTDFDNPDEDGNQPDNHSSDMDDNSEANLSNENGENQSNNEDEKDELKSLKKKFQTYYSRILFFAFLTKSEVNSLGAILRCIDEPENTRICDNLGLNKQVLQCINDNMNKFFISQLDYKIQNINTLAHDEGISPIERASIAIRKFDRISETEITTPAKTAKEMVSLLPDECFTALQDPDVQILDIASKMGEFAIEIVEHCEEIGISIDEIKDKIISIPTSSIAYEFTRKVYKILGLNINSIATKFTSCNLLDVKAINKRGKILNEPDYNKISNILCQKKSMNLIKLSDECDNLTEDNKMKFSAIVGNPPYQEEKAGTSDKQIYNYFMDEAIKLADKVMLITPARFLFNAGNTPKPWNKKMLNDPHFKVLFYEQDSSKIFPKIDIKGGVTITYHDNEKDFGAIEVFSHFDELSTIREKIINFEPFESLSNLIYAPESYKFTSEIHTENPWVAERLSKGHLYDITSNIFEKIPELLLDEKPDNDEEYVGLYGLSKKTRVTKWIKRKYIKDHDNLYSYKIFLPKANGSGAIGEILSTPVIGQPVIGHTQTFISIGCFETEEEATALLKYIKSKFARTLLGVLKITQDNKKSVWEYVPLQDFTDSSDINWNQSVAEIDKQLYAKYGLSEKEIAFIEEKVKPME